MLQLVTPCKPFSIPIQRQTGTGIAEEDHVDDIAEQFYERDPKVIYLLLTTIRPFPVGAIKLLFEHVTAFACNFNWLAKHLVAPEPRRDGLVVPGESDIRRRADHIPAGSGKLGQHTPLPFFHA